MYYEEPYRKKHTRTPRRRERRRRGFGAWLAGALLRLVRRNRGAWRMPAFARLRFGGVLP